MNKILNKKKTSNNDAEKNFIKNDMMRYRANSIAFWLCILAIISNVAMFFIIYKDKNCTPNFQLGADLIVNVLFLLATFLISEKCKAYDKKNGMGAIVLGVVEMLRIFWIPTYYHNLYLESIKLEGDVEIVGLTNGKYTWCISLLIVAGALLILAGIITIIKSNKLQKHIENLNLKEN